MFRKWNCRLSIDADERKVLMKVYSVVYSFGSYYREHTHVYAESKREVRKIMKNQFGSSVVIHEIEEE